MLDFLFFRRRFKLVHSGFPEITTTNTNNKAVSELFAIFMGDLEEIDHVSD